MTQVLFLQEKKKLLLLVIKLQELFRHSSVTRLPEITDEEVEAGTYARGSQDIPDRDVVADLKAAVDMLDRSVTGIDFVKLFTRVD